MIACRFCGQDIYVVGSGWSLVEDEYYFSTFGYGAAPWWCSLSVYHFLHLPLNAEEMRGELRRVIGEL